MSHVQVVFFLRRDLNENEIYLAMENSKLYRTIHYILFSRFTLELISRAEKLVNLSLYNERSTQVKCIHLLYRVSLGFKNSFPFGR